MSGGDVFVEVFPMQRLDANLKFLSVVLFAGVAVSALLGLALGQWAGRRALLPLTAVTRAAERIAGGDLTARLPSSTDAELARSSRRSTGPPTTWSSGCRATPGSPRTSRTSCVHR